MGYVCCIHVEMLCTFGSDAVIVPLVCMVLFSIRVQVQGISGLFAMSQLADLMQQRCTCRNCNVPNVIAVHTASRSSYSHLNCKNMYRSGPLSHSSADPCQTPC